MDVAVGCDRKLFGRLLFERAPQIARHRLAASPGRCAYVGHARNSGLGHQLDEAPRCVEAVPHPARQRTAQTKTQRIWNAAAKLQECGRLRYASVPVNAHSGNDRRLRLGSNDEHMHARTACRARCHRCGRLQSRAGLSAARHRLTDRVAHRLSQRRRCCEHEVVGAVRRPRNERADRNGAARESRRAHCRRAYRPIHRRARRNAIAAVSAGRLRRRRESRTGEPAGRAAAFRRRATPTSRCTKRRSAPRGRSTSSVACSA